MASAVGLRIDFNGAGLRRLARLSGHANQVRRLLALAVIYDGGARHEAARVGGVRIPGSSRAAFRCDRAQYSDLISRSIPTGCRADEERQSLVD